MSHQNDVPLSQSQKEFNKIPDLGGFQERAIECSSDAFRQVIESRRSVRVYLQDPIPESVVQDCLRYGLLAPNSSNLQPWLFFRVKNPEIKKQVVEACLSQPAASTAQELIVCVGDTRNWHVQAKRMVEHFKSVEAKGTRVPKGAWLYYQKLAPLMYRQGPLSIIGFLKRILFAARGLTTPTPRWPVSHGHMREWAIKSTALACENIMLGFRAHGYDTCPIEGFDESRLTRILGLKKGQPIVMVISAGRRDPERGIYGPRVRFDSSYFIKEI